MGHGNVQGFQIAGHRNFHGFIGNVNQVLVGSGAFVSDEESDFAEFARFDFGEALFAV